MKISKINFMSIAGGMAGGMVAKFVSKFTEPSEPLKDGEVDYVTVGVQAVAGAAISAFSKNDLLKGIGSGLIGVAGFKLASDLKIGESEAKTSGLGLLPSQNAIGLLASQNAVGRLPMASKPFLRGTEEEKKANATDNVR